jgi:hypothetical protein
MKYTNIEKLNIKESKESLENISQPADILNHIGIDS